MMVTDLPRIVLAVVLLVAAGIRLEGWQMDASGGPFVGGSFHQWSYILNGKWLAISSGPGTWKKHEKTSCKTGCHTKPVIMQNIQRYQNRFTGLEDAKNTTPEILVVMVYTGVPYQGNS